jgi:hypothetical protein
VRLRVVISTTAAALAVVTSAQATTLVTPAGAPLGGPLQAVVTGSRIPTPPGAVAVDLHPCPGSPYDACWDTTVLHLPTARGVDLRWTLMHELGHVFDDRVLAAADRAAFKRIIRYSGAWTAGDEPSGERFAEAYAGCALYAHAPYGGLQGQYGYSAGPETFRRVCELIRRAAGRPRAAPRYEGRPARSARTPR